MKIRFLFAPLFALALLACETLQESLPEAPTSPTQGVITSVPPGQGLPGTTPTTLTPPPTTTQPAQPTPTPAPTPGASSCRLAAGSGSGENCPRTSPNFLAAVNHAIDDAVAQHPEYFDLNDQRGDGGYYVKDSPGFTEAVVANLEARNLCATFDGEELAVKNSNDFNDQYDILIADGHIRRGEGSYRSTCRPAWF